MSIRQTALPFAGGALSALGLVAFLFYAGTGWRAGEASRDMYGWICQGLNTVWYGSAI